MKRLLIALLLVSTPLFAQATRDVQKKASRQTANVETLTADKTLTYLDAETQLLTPSGADRIVTLPSTNVWKAWTVKIVNEDATNKLVIKSSDGTTLDTLAAVGRVEFVARQATPTGSAHWTNLSKIGTLGVTDNSTACVGCVGQVVTMTTTNVTTSADSVWTAVGTAMGTLTAGSWMLCMYDQVDGKALLLTATGAIATNSSADGTGQVASAWMYPSSATNSTASGSVCTTVNLSSSQSYYAKAYTRGTTQIVAVGGFALRIR